MRKFLFLAGAQRFGDAALLLLRLFVGLFLIWSVWDRLPGGEAMASYAASLRDHGVTAPGFMAPFSVYLQLAIGLGFVLGLFARWAGIACAVHFTIIIAMIDQQGGMRGIFQSGCLVLIGLYLATHGAGRFSVDQALRANELPRTLGGGVRLRK